MGREKYETSYPGLNFDYNLYRQAKEKGYLKVYVNVSDPNRSVLSPGVPFHVGFLLVSLLYLVRRC